MESVSLSDRASQYAREVRAETRKVVWPDLRRTAIYTLVVVLSVAFVALLIYVVDTIFHLLLSHV